MSTPPALRSTLDSTWGPQAWRPCLPSKWEGPGVSLRGTRTHPALQILGRHDHLPTNDPVTLQRLGQGLAGHPSMQAALVANLDLKHTCLPALQSSHEALIWVFLECLLDVFLGVV